MISEYHRPKSEGEAIALLKRDVPVTVPLGGGTILSKSQAEVAVVDLQLLGLNQIEETSDQFLVGSTVTLDGLIDFFGKESAIGKAAIIEAGKNIRGMATVGGSLVSNGGRSALLTVLIALDAAILWKPGDRVMSIDEWLGQRRIKREEKLIIQIRLPKAAATVFESIGRSPVDQPIICCSVARFSLGKIRIALGGFGETPLLAYAGDEKGDYETAVGDHLRGAGDKWASEEYRREAGKLLAQRLVTSVGQG